MLPPKLQELWEGIEENRRTTLAMVSGLPEEEFVRREAGGWSVAEILEHLVLAETGTGKLLRKLLKENAGTLPPYPLDDSALKVRALDPSLGRMTQAPEAAQPKGSRGKEEILTLAAAAREATRTTFEMLSGADPRAVEFPHPFFGSMNLYEWPHRILLDHERQHHPQIAAIVGTPGTK